MADTIQMIHPDNGQLVDMPIDKWQQAAKEDNFRLAPAAAPTPIVDPQNPNNVLAINPDNGKEVSLPKDNWRAAYINDNFLTPQEYEAAKQKMSPLATPELQKAHEKDDFFTADKQFKMMRDGKEYSMSLEKLPEAWAAGYRFKDSNFNSLVQGSILTSSSTSAAATGAGHGIDPFARGIDKEIILDEGWGPKESNARKGIMLGEYIANNTKYHTAYALGELGGAAATIPMTGGAGLFGEAKAGAALGKLTEEAIIAERAAPSLGRTLLAKGAGTFIEGVGLASPTAAAQAFIDKNPKLAVETLALGGGLNIGFRGLGELAKGGVKAIENARLSAAAKEIMPAVSEEYAAKFGNASQQEGFLKAIGEKGLGKAGAAEKTIPTLEKMAAGEALSSVAPKLAASAEKISASALTARLEELGQAVSKVTKEAQVEGLTKFSKEVTPFIESTAKQINKLADKEGNLSLPQAVSLAENLGKEKAEGVLSTLKQQFHNEVIQQTFKAGDAAIEKLDAKVNAEWAQAKYNQQIASELIKPEFAAKVEQAAAQAGKTEGKGAGAVGSLLEKAFDLVTHKAAHLPAAYIGHAIGGPIGGAIGASISFVVNKAAHKVKDALLESYTSNPRNASKLTGWLGKQATNENLASYLVMDSVHAVQSKLDKIGDVLSKSAIKASTADHSNAIKEVLGTSVNGLSKQQQFAKISDHLATAASQPDLTANSIQELSNTLKNHHLPLAEQYEAHMMNKMQYLYSILPKDPTGKQPFTKDEKWQPTPAELDHFQRQLTLAQDPFYVLDLVKNNTISERDVATLSVLNPEILQMMRSEITKIAYSGKIDLPYQQKLSLSVLMGENMVSALNNIPLNQSIYGPVDNSSSPSPQGVTAPKQSGKGGSHIKAENISQMTPSQRIMGK